MKTYLLTLSTLGTALLLAGCDIAAQDGSGTDQRQSMNGLVVDGRVANGTVWVDRNNNNRIDDFEPRARTDSQGYYSYNPLTDTDYCDLPESAEEYRHCLSYGSSLDNAVIRVRGGIDLSTGERLKGVMALSTTLAEAGQQRQDPILLSPVSSLLQNTSSAVERNNVLEALGISEADLRLDFSDLNSGTEAELLRKQRLLANAVAIQTVLEVLTDVADDKAGTSREEKQVAIFASLTETLVNNPAKRPTRLDENDINALISQVKGQQDSQSAAAAAHLATVTSRLNRASPNDDGQTDDNLPPRDVAQTIKTNEVLFQLIKKDIKDNNGQAKSALQNSDFIDALDDAIGQLSKGEDLDIKSVVNDISKNGASDAASMVDNARLKATDWAGQWFVLQISEADEERADAGQSYVAVKFDGISGSQSGRMAICANLIRDEDKKSYPDEFFTGRWVQLGAGSIALDIDYEGVEVEGQMKALVKTQDNKPMFRFSTDIEQFRDESGESVANIAAAAYLQSMGRPQPDSQNDCTALTSDPGFSDQLKN